VICRYRALLAVPGLRRLLVSSLVARLPSGMYSLAVLLLVHASTGSFLAAGLAVGAFTLAGAVAGPALGALVDRVGQTRVLLPVAAGQASLLLALALLARKGAPVAAIVGLAALAGAMQPPIAGCTRALWSRLAVEEEALQTAYALDATSQELIWTLGPLLIGATAALLSPAAAVGLCALTTFGGTLLFATSSVSRNWRGGPGGHSSKTALASPGLVVLLATVLLAGVVIGAVEVGLPALAVQHGSHWAAGPLLALFSVGSMAGGLLYSARTWSGPLGPRYTVTLFVMGAGVTPLLAVHSLIFALPLSVLAGLAVAPIFACQLALVGARATPGTDTEAFTWHRTATIAGMAAGSILGGILVSAHGAGAAFAVGTTGVVLAGILAALKRDLIDPSAAPRVRPISFSNTSASS